MPIKYLALHTPFSSVESWQGYGLKPDERRLLKKDLGMWKAAHCASATAQALTGSSGLRNIPKFREFQYSEPWICQRCYHIWADARLRRHERSLNWQPSSFASRVRLYSTAKDDRSKVSRDDLPSRREGRRSLLSKRFSHLMDNFQANVFIAGQRLNDLTGYSGIEALKQDIELHGGLASHLPVIACLITARMGSPIHA